MRFAYFGTPSFSTLVLDALERAGYLPALVVTAPDKPQGRGLALTPPPAKQWALEHGIDVLQPASLKGEAFLSDKKASPFNAFEELKNTNWDLFIVAAYAKLLPQAILELPKHGCLNVHPSLLPKFRGPSPIVSAILADERETGVTIMAMTAAMDAGPIVAQARIEIAPEDWPPPASELTELLFTEGGNLLAETLPLWVKNQIDPVPQDDSQATFTKKFVPEDALLDLSADPWQQFLKIRAFDHGPRAHFFAERSGARLRVIVTEAAWVDGRLEIRKVLPEGRKEIPYQEFLNSGAVIR